MATNRRAGGEDELLDVRRAAALVGRHPETIRRWVWSGRLPARRSGHRLLVARADVEALVRREALVPTLAEWADRAAATRDRWSQAAPGASAADLVIEARRGARGRRERMPVVDASVVVDCVAPAIDPGLPSISLLARLAADEVEILAPRLLIEEVSNALLTGVRRGRWSGAAADAAHALVGDLPARLADEPRDLDRAWDLARRYDNHPVYDMVYVALAQQRGVQLVTADAALRAVLAGFDWVVAPEQALG